MNAESDIKQEKQKETSALPWAKDLRNVSSDSRTLAMETSVLNMRSMVTDY